MVQMARAEQTQQRYVTDGDHVYPYNEYLDDLLKRGELKFCERPLLPPARKAKPEVPPDDEVMVVVQNQLEGGLKDNDEPEADASA